MNTAMLRDSTNFAEFIDRVKAKREDAFDQLRSCNIDQLARARDRYNAFDEVVNLLDEIEAEDAAFSNNERDDEA